MRFPLGRLSILSFSLLGDTFTEAKNIADLALNLTKAEDDDTTRASGGWETTAAVLKQASLEFACRSDGTDDFFLALQDSFVSNVPIRMRADSIPEDAANGPQFTAWMEVFGLNKTENLKEIVKYQVSMKIVNPPAGSSSETPTFIAAADPA